MISSSRFETYDLLVERDDGPPTSPLVATWRLPHRRHNQYNNLIASPPYRIMSLGGKCNARLALGFALLGLGLSSYVLAVCEFYEVTYTNSNGRQVTEQPGLFNCKYYNGRQGTYVGPVDGVDFFAALSGFLAPLIALPATLLLFSSHWKFPCCPELRVRNIGLSSCLLMGATLFQPFTILVLESKGCQESHNGECRLLLNAWLSVGAAVSYFLASCFNREMASGGK